MYLAQVRIRNFRNLRDVTLELKQGLNVIVGENNVGKTNLFDAIRVALGATAGAEPVYLSKEDRHRTSAGSYINEPITIALVFKDLSNDEQAEFLDALDYNERNPADSTATIQYEWTYQDLRDRWSFRRWGSSRKEQEGVISEDILQALPVTYLGALRDAERVLAPGRQSRLARLLNATATQGDRTAITDIGKKANKELQKADLVKRAEAKISEILTKAAKTDLLRGTAVRATASDFERIIRGLRVLLYPESGASDDEQLFDELSSNGLGYNNLIYIATVLAELEATKDAALPILLVEEPEAHLHPHLQTLLASHLANQASRVQTIVTTHSPTIAAHVEPRQIAVMHRSKHNELKIIRIDACGLDDRQEKQLKRLLDVTRASMLFAQGIILVEGISETIMIPALASQLGIDLGKSAVSVVPVGGVDFATIARLFGKSKIGVPLSVLTDADPDIIDDTGWRTAEPVRDKMTKKPARSERAQSIHQVFELEPSILVEISELTFEYDLAAAAPGNSLIMFDAWASLYKTSPQLLSRSDLEKESDASHRALLLWRAVCRGSPQHGKAQLAQELAIRIRDGKDAAKEFVVPTYLERAIKHASRINE